MRLLRTPDSFYSIHLFYKVDTVVYCEGSIDADEISTEETFDVIFWKQIFRTYANSNKKYYFNSIGGKEHLLAIAEILPSDQNTIIICMDSDYDNILLHNQNRNNCLLTHGYSWENDIISRESIYHCILSLSANEDLATTLADNTLSMIGKVNKNLLKWAEIEITFQMTGKPFLLRRDAPLSFIDMTKSPPKIRIEYFNKKLKEIGYSSYPRKKISIRAGHENYVIPGKIMMKLIYHFIYNEINKVIPKSKFSYHLFVRLLISSLILKTERCLGDISCDYFRRHLRNI